MKPSLQYNDLLVRKINRLTGRKWLLRFFLPVFFLAVLSSCEHEEIAPATATPSTTNARLANNPAKPVHTMLVIARDGSCLRTIYGNTVLEMPETGGYYLLPYVTDATLVPELDMHYIVTYQQMVADDRFTPPGSIVCLGVPGNYEGGYAVRILDIQPVLTAIRN